MWLLFCHCLYLIPTLSIASFETSGMLYFVLMAYPEYLHCLIFSVGNTDPYLLQMPLLLFTNDDACLMM